MRAGGCDARPKQQGLGESSGSTIGSHSFRATGITNDLEIDGTLDLAQAMSAHESPRTTMPHDRTADVL